jgi:glycosyltransferase involved in cell wall biosynthesis
VLVVDNQSVDGTASVARRYAAADSRFRLVSAGDRAGLSYTRNVGIEAARHDSIAICDGDDIVAPGWAAAIMAGLQASEIVTGPLELDRLNPPWLAASRGRSVERSISTFYGIFPYAAGGNMALRRAVWRRLGGFATEVHGTEDIEFSLRAWLSGVEIGFAQDAVVHYRYRQSARDLWRQGRSYGRCRPLVARMLRDAGMAGPSPLAGWRSWVWLLAHVGHLRSRAGRATWAWVAANRIGHVEGSLAHRVALL